MNKKVILLSGGEGKRLWPFTRKDRSKQESHYIGSESTFKKLYGLLADEWGSENIIVSSGKAQRNLIFEVVSDETRVWVQPSDRNNAAGIRFSLMLLDPEIDQSVVALIPTDQIILDEGAFIEDVHAAFELAEKRQQFCAIGTEPDRINTGYGHLHVGKGAGRINVVDEFIEKPSCRSANDMMASGEYLWNTGIYVVPGGVLLKAFERHLPEIDRAAQEEGTGIDDDHYQKLPAISIDYGIIEKVDDLMCVKGDFPWLDVGTYRIISHYIEENEENNRFDGDVVGLDSKNNLVISSTRPTVLNGIEDLIVIDLDDLLFICSKERMDQIRELVQALSDRGREDLI